MPASLDWRMQLQERLKLLSETWNISSARLLSNWLSSDFEGVQFGNTKFKCRINWPVGLSTPIIPSNIYSSNPSLDIDIKMSKRWDPDELKIEDALCQELDERPDWENIKNVFTDKFSLLDWVKSFSIIWPETKSNTLIPNIIRDVFVKLWNFQTNKKYDLSACFTNYTSTKSTVQGVLYILQRGGICLG